MLVPYVCIVAYFFVVAEERGFVGVDVASSVFY